MSGINDCIKKGQYDDGQKRSAAYDAGWLYARENDIDESISGFIPDDFELDLYKIIYRTTRFLITALTVLVVIILLLFSLSSIYNDMMSVAILLLSCAIALPNIIILIKLWIVNNYAPNAWIALKKADKFIRT
tara:strand:- start:574 stop:972 length:399 start_codon:yes stop_codon:yes gene_type:complete